VRDRYIMHVHMVAMLLRLELSPNEANSQQMIIEAIPDGSLSSTKFRSFDNLTIKVM
jgi:hypothetical protein